MISENLAMYPIQVIPPDLKCKHDGRKLQVIGRVVLPVTLQLLQSIGYNAILLHQYTLQPTPRCMIHHKILIGGG